MKNVLLVDTNFSSAPIYDYLINKGYNVFVCGVNKNDFIAKTSINFIDTDYSNIDALARLARQLKIDYIIPGCNDISYQACCFLNKDNYFFGIDNYSNTILINNKEKFREIAIHLELPAPKVIPADTLEGQWPVIVKPVDAYSGRGVTVIHEKDKNILALAIQRAKDFSKTGTCIIEEFVEGQLYSHSAFIVDGRIEVDFFVEEHSSANPFAVDTSRVRYDFSEEIRLRIRNSIELLVKKLKLVDGLVHTQFIKKGNDFWLIEVTRRCPGDLYSKLIETSTSFPYVEAYVSPFLNQQVKLKCSTKQRYIMRHTVSPPEECLFSSILFNIPVALEKMIFLALSGDKIQKSPFSRIALLFISAASEYEICNLMKITCERKLYTLSSAI